MCDQRTYGETTMPARYEMTWCEGEKRWAAHYRGKLYKVSCRQLGCGPETATKRGSYLQANLWFDAKRREADAENDAGRGKVQEAIDRLTSSYRAGGLPE